MEGSRAPTLTWWSRVQGPSHPYVTTLTEASPGRRYTLSKWKKCFVTDEFERNVRFHIWMDLSLQDFSPLVGRSEKNWWISNASEEDEGVYTCVCTWMHNQTEYQSSGSRSFIKGEAAFSRCQNKNVPLGGEMIVIKNIRLKEGNSRNGGSTRALEDWLLFRGRHDG